MLLWISVLCSSYHAKNDMRTPTRGPDNSRIRNHYYVTLELDPLFLVEQPFVFVNMLCVLGLKTMFVTCHLLLQSLV